MEALGVALGIMLLAFNVAATLAALLSKRALREQRLLQVLFVWAVPILGASLVLYFTTASEKPLRPEPEDLANRSEYPGTSLGHTGPNSNYP